MLPRIDREQAFQFPCRRVAMQGRSIDGTHSPVHIVFIFQF
jgi:hypothetical protein